MKHWTQTRAGKKVLRQRMKASWVARKNGATPPQDGLDEFQLMGQVLQLFDRLPQRGKEYIKQRIS